MRQLALAALVACGPGVVHPQTVTVTAPAQSTWTSADLETGSSEEHYTSSYTGDEHSFEVASVRLVVRHGQTSSSVELDAKMFGLERNDHDWATTRFELATSIDGGWIGVTPDHGKTWLLVDPESLHACHAPTGWQRLPAPHDGTCPAR